VKGPSGCAVRQNSKSDLVYRPVVLEQEEDPTASLTLGRRSNRQATAMTMIQVIEIRTSAAIVEIVARPSRAARARTSRSNWSDLDEQRLLAYKKEASLKTGSFASSQAGLRPQYARASGQSRIGFIA
jgi:hypothetical protein